MACSTTPFRLESDMTAALGRIAQKIDRTKCVRLTVLEKPYIGTVIPDILIGRWLRRASRLPRSFTFFDAFVLNLIDKTGSITEENLHSQLFVSAEKIRACIARLERAGVLSCTQQSRLSASFDLSSEVEITAIEMKLSRWREALDQAIQYKAFAERVGVVLDGNRVQATADLMVEFRANRVGLFLQRGSSIRELVPMCASKPHSADRFIAAHKLSSVL